MPAMLFARNVPLQKQAGSRCFCAGCCAKGIAPMGRSYKGSRCLPASVVAARVEQVQRWARVLFALGMRRRHRAGGGAAAKSIISAGLSFLTPLALLTGALAGASRPRRMPELDSDRM